MKINSFRLFNRPILSTEYEDFTNNTFTSSFNQYSVSGEELNLDLSISLENDYFIKLINNYQVGIYIHLENSKTKYREVIPLKCGQNKLSININKLNGNIDALISICALDNFDMITEEFASDFIGYSFHIKQGDILGIAEQYSIPLIKDQKEIVNLPSIFSIMPNPSQQVKDMSFDLTKTKIYIILPKEDFDYFSKLRRNIYNDIFYSSLILPALIYTFFFLKEDSFHFEENQDSRWFIAINDICKSKNLILKQDSIDLIDPIKYSQILLEWPINKTLTSLYKNSGDDNE